MSRVSSIIARLALITQNNGRLLGRLVAADLPGKIHCSLSCAQAQNYVKNGNLPGKSAAT